MAVSTSHPDSWNSSNPSGTSSIRDGDNEIRSSKAKIQSVIADEHYFDGTSASSASGGVHKPGSARIFMSATRASIATPASTDSVGRVAFAADLGSLHVAGASSNTTVVWGADPPGAQWYSMVTTLGSGSTSAPILTTEAYDIGGYGAAAQASVATVPSGFSGRHMIVANLQTGSVVTGTLRAAIRKGANDIIGMSSVGSTNAPAGLSVTAIDRGIDGDAYTLLLFQNSGGLLSINSIYFAVQRL